ncbi:MAG: uncharacterized protein QOF30_1634 [Acidimicrobiaceae bacterium]|jgi:uncharacterized protein (TIGR00251 family)|nr:uncharacterized protein [Acidimicrobiaceae bacterium]
MAGKDTVDLLFDVIEREDGDSEKVDIVLRVWLQPGAGRTTVVGRHGDALKIKVAAPPEGGRANQAVAQLLSYMLGVPATSVSLESGETTRAKRLRVGPVDLDVVRTLIANSEPKPKVGGSARSGGNVRGTGGVL